MGGHVGSTAPKAAARRPATLSLSTRGEFVAVGSEDGLVFVWDVASGAAIQPLTAGHNKIHRLAFGADLHQAMTRASRRGPVRGCCWRPATPAATWSFGTCRITLCAVIFEGQPPTFTTWLSARMAPRWPRAGEWRSSSGTLPPGECYSA